MCSGANRKIERPHVRLHTCMQVGICIHQHIRILLWICEGIIFDSPFSLRMQGVLPMLVDPARHSMIIYILFSTRVVGQGLGRLAGPFKALAPAHEPPQGLAWRPEEQKPHSSHWPPTERPNLLTGPQTPTLRSSRIQSETPIFS